MEQQFKNFLIIQGYKEYTPSGNKSTVYDYIGRINQILEWEKMTWSELKTNIKSVVKKYDVGGVKEKVGKKSHNAYKSALKAFDRMCKG